MDLQVLEQAFPLSPWGTMLEQVSAVQPWGGADLIRLLNAHPAALSFPLFSRTREENKKKNLVGQDKGREIAYQLPSQANQP